MGDKKIGIMIHPYFYSSVRLFIRTKALFLS